jgi:general secretion pathway protein M
MSERTIQSGLALGLLVLILSLFLFGGVVPLISATLENYEQKQDILFRLHRARQTVARKQEVTTETERAKQILQQQNYFIPKATAALASADLQNFIKTSIATVGGQLTSTQVLPAREENGINRVMIKVRMTVDMEMLRSILYDVETSQPLMIVDEIDIRPVRGRRNRKTRKIEPTNMLNINFQVSGFFKIKEAL